MTFVLTPKQAQAQKILAGGAKHVMLFGGSRSGKTALFVRSMIIRAMKAPGSRHAILRFRFNAVKSAVVEDTFPKVMALAFPDVKAEINRTDWFADLPGKSRIWFGGLDDKERTEKILGNEFATMLLNECSQIPFVARETAVTRLAQRVEQVVAGQRSLLRPVMYYDCNPPPKRHWTYQLFVRKRHPGSGQPLNQPDEYAAFQINPEDNREHQAEGYLETLQGMSARMRRRFLEGEFEDDTEGQLFSQELIDAWRTTDGLPDMVRVVVAVDPSGSGDEDNQDNDAIGIIVAGIGTDGIAYVLEDCTVKAGPATWARVATSAYERHSADLIVGEANYGGDMVRTTILTARPRTPYKAVNATRGKVVRAEPIASLYEQGKIRHAGRFDKLEDEMAGMTTAGYVGQGSPNRADAMVWAMSELFPGVVKGQGRDKSVHKVDRALVHMGGMGAGSWM